MGGYIPPAIPPWLRYCFTYPFVCSKLLPKLQRGGGHATILHTGYANYTILATQRGGGMAQWPPPKYAPDGDSFYLTIRHDSQYRKLSLDLAVVGLCFY